MTQPRTMELGPYLLVRPTARPHLRIYTVHPKDEPDAERIAVLWRVEAEEYGIPTEWRMRCEACVEPAYGRRLERASRAFEDRDRALTWLRRHRAAKHPHLLKGDEA